MTDCPQKIEAGLSINPGWQPYTVLFLIPDYMRGDESCEADWIRRVWMFGDPAQKMKMIRTAKWYLSEIFGWTENDVGDELQQRLDELACVAIYAGHIFDIYQPDEEV